MLLVREFAASRPRCLMRARILVEERDLGAARAADISRCLTCRTLSAVDRATVADTSPNRASLASIAELLDPNQELERFLALPSRWQRWADS